MQPDTGGIAAPDMRQQHADMEEIQPNLLEQLRTARIRQNYAALAAIGLEPVCMLAGQKKARSGHDQCWYHDW
jgi:hypothetical protein